MDYIWHCTCVCEYTVSEDHLQDFNLHVCRIAVEYLYFVLPTRLTHQKVLVNQDAFRHL